jgi:hypothetical protein
MRRGAAAHVRAHPAARGLQQRPRFDARDRGLVCAWQIAKFDEAQTIATPVKTWQIVLKGPVIHVLATMQLAKLPMLECRDLLGISE